MLHTEGPEQDYVPFISRRIISSNSDFNHAHSFNSYGVLIQIDLTGLNEIEEKVNNDAEASIDVKDNLETDTIMASHLLR